MSEYTLSANIKALRAKRGMTQDQLVAKSGISKGYLSEMENGKKESPSQAKIAALCIGLDCEPSDLFAGVDLAASEGETLIEDMVTVARMMAPDRLRMAARVLREMAAEDLEAAKPARKSR